MTLHKNDVILDAQMRGYFRSKKADVWEAIEKEILEENPDTDVVAILAAERARRHADYVARQRRKAAKDLADADKPLSGNTASLQVATRPAQGVYVFTVAQNNTDVHAPFFAALKGYCKARNAELLIGKTAYNKQGFCQPEHDGDGIWYALELRDFLQAQEISFGNSLVVWNGSANIIPTAHNPLTQWERASAFDTDQIIPAVKLSLATIPATNGCPKTLHSTGAVTLPNYVQRKAGQTAQREHNISALVLEFDDTGRHWIRQLECMDDSGCFYDLDKFYTPEGEDGSFEQQAIVALQPGDIHSEKPDIEQTSILLSMLRHLQPTNVILHDLLDFTSRNHHNIKDPFFRLKMDSEEMTVRDDLTCAADFVQTVASHASVFIVESNHDLALDRWLSSVDWRDDSLNAVTYLQCALYKAEQIVKGEEVDLLKFAFERVANRSMPRDVVFLKESESLMLGGVEMSQHGHNGPNGAKGSPAAFRKLGRAMNTGHTHTPSITGRVWTAGVHGSLDMGYNVGASSWRHATIVTYANGQRQMLDSTNGWYHAR